MFGGHESFSEQFNVRAVIRANGKTASDAQALNNFNWAFQRLTGAIMALLVAACRLSARLAARQLRQESVLRSYRTSTACLAAQSFTMPALSPTMTEGNIASWKIKEGESFAAGDVLLEIETDKASMDVEAQEDGVLAKIVLGDGAKGIKVGARIGVVAEEGDDLASLEIPEEESASPPAPSPKEESAKPDPRKTSSSQDEAQNTAESSSGDKTPAPRKKSGKKAEKQTYPLLPSVEWLIHAKGLDASDVEKMTPSGPKNRLLKGDVLAYLGSVPDAYPTELSSKIEKLSHLDLSNIRIPPPKPAPKAARADTPPPVPVIEDTEVAVSVSMAAVLEVQRRVEDTLGTFLPLSTFIARAADFANDDLPRSTTAKPTADELFNAVLGLDKISSGGARGNFMPQITALPETAVATMARSRASKPKGDIIDILSGKTTASRPVPRSLSGVAATTNIFSVSVPRGDERRARVFLDRVKTVLEAEPGRLIL
ncbi:MAG: pyridoxine biosynthesis protein [Claussenomyces sp. TS43310]|nr:MAG: pyridoxine biosynthesis protein [Claussenomyces sp. TS43310]